MFNSTKINSKTQLTQGTGDSTVIIFCISSVKLKRKIVSYFTSKNVFTWKWQRNQNSRHANKTMVNHKQVQRTEGSVLL